MRASPRLCAGRSRRATSITISPSPPAAEHLVDRRQIVLEADIDHAALDGDDGSVQNGHVLVRHERLPLSQPSFRATILPPVSRFCPGSALWPPPDRVGGGAGGRSRSARSPRGAAGNLTAWPDPSSRRRGPAPGGGCRSTARTRDLLLRSALAVELGCAQVLKRTDAVIDTASPADIEYPLGGSICRLFNLDTPRHGLRCAEEPSAGPVANIESLHSGRIDLGIVPSDVLVDAVAGQGPFAGRGARYRPTRSMCWMAPDKWSARSAARAHPSCTPPPIRPPTSVGPSTTSRWLKPSMRLAAISTILRALLRIPRMWFLNADHAPDQRERQGCAGPKRVPRLAQNRGHACAPRFSVDHGRTSPFGLPSIVAPDAHVGLQGRDDAALRRAHRRRVQRAELDRRCLGRRHGRPLERAPARHALAGERCGVRGGGRRWRCAASRGTSAGGHYRCELSGGRRKERLLGRRATINHVSGNHALEVDVVACHRLAKSSASGHHRPSPHSTCGARGRCGRPGFDAAARSLFNPRTDVEAQTGATNLFCHSGLQPKRPVDQMHHPPLKP